MEDDDTEQNTDRTDTLVLEPPAKRPRVLDLAVDEEEEAHLRPTSAATSTSVSARVAHELDRMSSTTRNPRDSTLLEWW